MKIDELLTTYWSQIILLLSFVGYFGKRLFDTKSKKREINHTLFQEHKIKSINDFYNFYAINKQMWYELPIYNVMKHQITPNELDKLISPSLNDLRKSVNKLQIYFDKNDFNTIKSVQDNINSINQKLTEIYFDIEKTPSVTVDVNEFQYFRDGKLDDNNKVFEKINKLLKKTYK
ncbi:hypothetical protein ACFFVB_16125 [Formosa undariae]|uniref:Uncharacterized protein n=1 Tax=Formosa undariae TaxID=1325436 RepID=A0ABV5F586_9FLAO